MENWSEDVGFAKLISCGIPAKVTIINAEKGISKGFLADVDLFSQDDVKRFYTRYRYLASHGVLFSASRTDGVRERCFVGFKIKRRLIFYWQRCKFLLRGVWVKNCVVPKDAFVGFGTRIVGIMNAGRKLYINTYCNLYGEIYIGDYVKIGPQTIIWGESHQYEGGRLIDRQGFDRLPIVIGNDVWIASHCTILKGVVLNDGAVVAAGSVVTHDVPSNAVVAGIPAKVIKYRK